MKLAGLIAIVLALLVVIVMLVGGDGHGPGRHFGAGDTAGRTELVAGQR